MVERRFVKPIAHSCLVSPHSKAVLSLASHQSDLFRPHVPYLYGGHQRFHSQGSTSGTPGAVWVAIATCRPSGTKERKPHNGPSQGGDPARLRGSRRTVKNL